MKSEAIMRSIVFADLCGSTGMFEELGNAKATKAVTRLTQWMSQIFTAHQGRTVKTLGDGVLCLFPTSEEALQACAELQRQHSNQIANWPEKLQVQIQIGVATGEVIEEEGDCFGDAVNTASRLADMSGAGQIWANAMAIQSLPEASLLRYFRLGLVPIRGKAEPQELFRLEWRVANTSLLTMPAALSGSALTRQDNKAAAIDMRWLDVSKRFEATGKPILIGRESDSDFVVADSRVSRLHATISWKLTPSGGHFLLEDNSSYGTWVKFSSGQEVELRRSICTLSTSGEIALGAAFSDFTVPTIAFTLHQTDIRMQR